MLAETAAIRSAFMKLFAQSLRSIANSIRYVTVVACIPNIVVGNVWGLTLLVLHAEKYIRGLRLDPALGPSGGGYTNQPALR